MSNQLFGFDTDKDFDYENGFYLTSHITRLGKLLAHYEIYKMIVHLPGHVIECGVFKGASFLRLATFRELLESPYSRKLIGFDAFGKFPKQDNKFDAEFIDRFESAAGSGISDAELASAFNHKGITNFELIKGDVTSTIPAYTSEHPELKISLLHVDVDVYQPTVVILNHLYERVVPGGVIIFDDYGTVAGETKAVDEFFSGTNVKFRKLAISHTPTFIVKE